MDGIQQLAGVMQLEQRRLEHAAENLSNVETDGFQSHVGSRAAADKPVPLRPTGRPLDLSVTGGGSLTVLTRTPDGFSHASAVRGGSFSRDRDGYIVDGRGRFLAHSGKPIHLPEGATVREDGALVKDGTVLGHIPLANGSQIRSGFLPGSDVNPIGEMVNILDAQRQFETAQKTITAIDSTRQKATSDVGKIQ